ncbi:MAG: polysaccharide deacetylase family protein, partial [Defluviitaleaceae bacterium]|nr:polysaccharide deacetylase family protein [Defluviitaleaceae bacterium]
MKKRIIACCISILTLTAVFAAQVFAAPIHWGLHFEKKGEIPVGNATDEYLAKYNACFHGPSSQEKKTVYLTFDTGYDNGYTAKILDTLKENKVPAAFFVLGSFIKDKPELAKRMVDEGHIIGNHTMRHPDMSQKDAEGFASQLTQVEEIYKSVIGADMKKYYRPPEGTFSEENLKQAQKMGYKTILWSIAYKDWNVNDQPSREEAFSKLMGRLHPGAILLLHSTSATN